MKVTVTADGETRIVRIEGRLDGLTSPQLEQEILKLDEDGHHRLALELEALEYISSAGLRVLLLAVKKARAAGGRVVLYGAGGMIREILEVSGFLSILPLADTREEALAQLKET